MGVIAALFGLVVVGSIFLSGQSQISGEELANSIQKLQAKEAFVCNSEPGTAVSEKIILTSGSILEITSTPNSHACILFGDKKECATFKCPQEGYTLDLNTNEFKELYKTHEFTCFIERTDLGVKIDCKG